MNFYYYANKEDIPHDQYAQEWGVSCETIGGMVGVLVKGGKVLDDLAAEGYHMPKLPECVGPTSEELAKRQVPPQGYPQGLRLTAEDLQLLAQNGR